MNIRRARGHRDRLDYRVERTALRHRLFDEPGLPDTEHCVTFHKFLSFHRAIPAAEFSDRGGNYFRCVPRTAETFLLFVKSPENIRSGAEAIRNLVEFAELFSEILLKPAQKHCIIYVSHNFGKESLRTSVRKALKNETNHRIRLPAAP